MASVYPSTQWGELVEPGIPCYAASDIWAGTIVRVASSGDWAVQMVGSTTEQPLGIARDYAKQGESVDVIVSTKSVKRLVAGASVTRMSEIHVTGTSSGVHPITGVTVTYPVAGPVVPASGVGNWSVGQAFESAAINDKFAVRINPRALIGLSKNTEAPW